MTAHDLLIKKYHVQTHLGGLQLYREGKNNNNIYIVEQLETVHSYICIVAFHLGTIDESREGREVGVKPEDGEWWTHPEDGRMDPDVHDRRKMLAEQLFSN